MTLWYYRWSIVFMVAVTTAQPFTAEFTDHLKVAVDNALLGTSRTIITPAVSCADARARACEPGLASGQSLQT